MLMFLMAFLVGQDEWSLLGEARPVLLSGTPERLWVLRQADGEMPEWWVFEGRRGTKVELPENTRFAVPMISGDSLWTLDSEKATIWNRRPHGKLAHRQSLEIGDIPKRIHPRLDGVFESMGGFQYFPVFEPGHVVIYALKDGGLLDHHPLPLAKGFSRDTTPNQGSYMQPKVLAGPTGLVWKQGQQSFLWESQQPRKLKRLEHPKLKNMEQAVPIPTQHGVHWLIHGGQRGDLSSFGWRVINGRGKSVASGRGIVTRFGLIHDKGPLRLLVWSVSQKIRSQLWSAMSGSRTFLGQALQMKGDDWEAIQKIEVKLAKGKRVYAFGLFWQSDLNGDGLCDLAAADEKHGLRVFTTKKDGRFQKSAVKTDHYPHEVLSLGKDLFIAKKNGSDWQLIRGDL